MWPMPNVWQVNNVHSYMRHHSPPNIKVIINSKMSNDHVKMMIMPYGIKTNTEFNLAIQLRTV